MIAENELASLVPLVLSQQPYYKIKQKQKIHTKLVRIKVCLKWFNGFCDEWKNFSRKHTFLITTHIQY